MISLVNGQIEPATFVEGVVPGRGRSSSPVTGPRTDPSAQEERKAPEAASAERSGTVAVLPERSLRLKVDQDTHEVIAEVIDQETNKVIREIPAEEMRRAGEVIRALLGQLVDKRA
jgi:uncharacterized FlaG/YvyC family protein